MAVEEFTRLGYCKTTIRGIAAGLQLTKGAVYFHYPSKIALARAVIEEGALQLAALSRGALAGRAPALEALIDISFAVALAEEQNRLLHSAFRLSAEISDNLGHTASMMTTLAATTGELVHHAISQGDLLDGAVPDEVARLVADMSYGIRHLTMGACSSVHLAQCWLLLLPGLVDERHVDYFRQFAIRKSRAAETNPTNSGRRVPQRELGLVPFPCDLAASLA